MNFEEVMEELMKSVRKEKREIYVAECPICKKKISGFTEEQVITLAKTHIISKHKELMG
jgi:hypothetical protein